MEASAVDQGVLSLVDFDRTAEFGMVLHTDIQYAVKCGQARVVPSSAERCFYDSGWSCTIQGPTRSGIPSMLKVSVFLSDDESEPVRIDSFIIAEL